MPDELVSCSLDLEPQNNERLGNLCGALEKHLRLIEAGLGVELNNRAHAFQVIGVGHQVDKAADLLRSLYDLTATESLTPNRVREALHDAEREEQGEDEEDLVVIRTRRGEIRGRGRNQQRYLRRIDQHDLNFGIGPAGTGKTYLAVAAAVGALEAEQVRRILLVRPAVEAGEKLGFLPGDLNQKIDPYLRPLYDALYDMLGFERVAKLMDRNVIEVAPLAFMRGRTLNDSFVILDEAQNATPEQMKMFLTRIGFGSTAVITGDVTQVDLPRGTQSGLRQVTGILKGVEGVSFTFFQANDVVRHPLVQRIVKAYDRWSEKE